MNLNALRALLPPAPMLPALMLPACATLAPGYEQPTVNLASFRAMTSEGMSIRVRESGSFDLQPSPR